MKYTVVKGDLFTADKKYVLAHCVASDLRMGAGIATQFVKRNPFMRSVLNTSTVKVGNVLFYDVEEDKVFNLITKEYSYDKPTREDFNKTIVGLRDKMIKHNFKYLAVPLIGSGLDRLDWNVSEEYIKDVFADTDIEIMVYTL